MNAPGAIEWSEDFDFICGYLSEVDGIGGAVFLDGEGLEQAHGAGSEPEISEAAPWFLQSFLETKEFAAAHHLELPLEQLSCTESSFLLCREIGAGYLVTSGKRGSYELFRGRIDRCAEMMEQVLKQRRLAK